MALRSLRFDASFDTFSISVDVPTEALDAWFSGVRDRNARSRMRDAGESPPTLVHQDHCPRCEAGAPFLTSVELEDGRFGACLKCRATFPLGG